MEKYGSIPPRFTKDWWGYFWEYYKWHVLGTAFVVMLVAVWLFQCTHRPQYDMTIVYGGHRAYSQAEADKLSEIAAEYIADADGNGNNSVYFQPLVFSEKAGSEDYDYAVQTKLDLTFIDDCTYIYLMDEIEAVMYMQRDTITEMFESTELFAAGTEAETMLGDADGIPHAVSLKNSKILKDNGIYCDDLYLMVRVQLDGDEKNTASHEGALRFAKALTEE